MLKVIRQGYQQRRYNTIIDRYCLAPYCRNECDPNNLQKYNEGAKIRS